MTTQPATLVTAVAAGCRRKGQTNRETRAIFVTLRAGVMP
jgi:hypothetical protein